MTESITSSGELSLGQKIDLCIEALPAQFRYVRHPLMGADPMDGLLKGIRELCVSFSESPDTAEFWRQNDQLGKALHRVEEVEAYAENVQEAAVHLCRALDMGISAAVFDARKRLADLIENRPYPGHEICNQRQGADSPASATTDLPGDHDALRDGVTTPAHLVHAPGATPGAQSAPATHPSEGEMMRRALLRSATVVNPGHAVGNLDNLIRLLRDRYETMGDTLARKAADALEQEADRG